MMTVRAYVVLACLLGVVNRVDVMPVCNMGMMASLLMIPSFMVFSCCFMVASGVLKVLCGLAMVLGGFFGHGKTLR
jgi:hypothetical protein